MAALLPAPPPPAGTWPRRDARHVWDRVTYALKVRRLLLALVEDPDRRRHCRADFQRFCATYFPKIYFDPNRFHLELAADLQRLLLAKAPTLQLKALAAPRGLGKTTVLILFALWAGIYGHARFVLILCDNADHADERLAALKSLVLTSAPLYADFPEICGPVRDFGGDARAAAGSTPDYPWSKDLVRLASGPWIASYGMDSGIAGRLKNFERPDLIVVDDAESVDSVKSPAETERLRDRLFQEVMKLPGAGKPALLVWICTIKILGCLGDELTDPKLNPEWRGQRYPGLTVFPKREDFWNYYMELVKPNGRGDCPEDAVKPPAPSGVPLASASGPALALGLAPDVWASFTDARRSALAFYAANQAAMDEGAVCLDPQRLPLHELYYQRAVLGDKAWYCEVQQAPLKDDRLKDLQLEIEVLTRRKVGPPRGVVPAWAKHVLLTLDLGRHACHWEASAWDDAFKTSCLIDQGIQATNLNRDGEYRLEDDPGRREVLVEQAILHALEETHKRASAGWPFEGTGMMQPARAVGVDVGGTAEAFAWQETVLRFCAARARWIPIKGSGWSARQSDRALARHWICEEKNNPGRRVDADSDYYKTSLFDALNAPIWQTAGVTLYPGTRILHKDTPNEYLRQHTAEKWVEAILKEEAPSHKAMRVGWNHLTSIPNHFFDAAWMNLCLADLCKHLRVGSEPSKKKKYGIIGKAFQ